MPTKQIDIDDQTRNMFGITDCPTCGGKYRWPTQPNHPQNPNTIICDDCSHTEPIPPQTDNTNETNN